MILLRKPTQKGLSLGTKSPLTMPLRLTYILDLVQADFAGQIRGLDFSPGNMRDAKLDKREARERFSFHKHLLK